MPIPAFQTDYAKPHPGDVRKLLALSGLAVMAGGLGAGVIALRNLLAKVESLGRRIDEANAGQPDAKLDERLRAVTQAAANAEQASRGLSRQVTELNRVAVDQAVILVEVRDLVRGRHLASSGQPTGDPEAKGAPA